MGMQHVGLSPCAPQGKWNNKFINPTFLLSTDFFDITWTSSPCSHSRNRQNKTSYQRTSDERFTSSDVNCSCFSWYRLLGGARGWKSYRAVPSFFFILSTLWNNFYWRCWCSVCVCWQEQELLHINMLMVYIIISITPTWPLQSLMAIPYLTHILTRM